MRPRPPRREIDQDQEPPAGRPRPDPIPSPTPAAPRLQTLAAVALPLTCADLAYAIAAAAARDRPGPPAGRPRPDPIHSPTPAAPRPQTLADAPAAAAALPATLLPTFSPDGGGDEPRDSTAWPDPRPREPSRMAEPAIPHQAQDRPRLRASTVLSPMRWQPVAQPPVDAPPHLSGDRRPAVAEGTPHLAIRTLPLLRRTATPSWRAPP
ncbi:hypothetical protein EJB05_40323, partial [Eragrostis curvula]